MNTPVEISAYRHYIDMSGIFGEEDIVLGNVLFNEKFRNKFITEFYIAFPNLQGFQKKGSTLSEEKLLQVIEHMNNKRIRMVCLKFPLYKYKKTLSDARYKLKQVLNKEPDISFPKERAISSLYFYLLKENSFKNYNYEGQVCIESQFNIDKVLSKLNYIARAEKYFFSISYNHRKNQHMLKFADFVASAGRRIPDFKLTQFKYFKIINPEIEEKHLKLSFGINKIESDKEKSLKSITY